MNDLSFYKSRNIVFCLSSALYFILIVMAILLYKERIVFTDMAFHSFYIIKNNALAIQNGRYGAFISQLFPLTAITLNGSLKTILVAYSVSFVVINYCTFLFCFFIREYSFALLLVLYNCIMVTHDFYWIQSELQQGITFSIAFFAFLNFLSKKEKHLLFQKSFLYAGTIFLCLFHPLLVFVIFFFSMIIYIENKAFKKINSVYKEALLFYIIISIARWMLIPT